MQLKPDRHTPILLALGAILLVVCLRFAPFDFFERLERVTYDMRARNALKHRGPVATNLAFVYIDENTIQQVRSGVLGYSYGLYWPRHVYARMVAELKDQGATLAAFDVLFGELRTDHPSVELQDGSRCESDEYFAMQMRNASNVVLAVTPAICPPDLFRTNALATGDITTEKDPDGILRRVDLFRFYTNWHWAFREAESRPEYGIDLRSAEIEKNRILLPRSEEDIEIPLDENGDFEVAALFHPPPGTPARAKPFSVERVWHMGVIVAAYAGGFDLCRAQVETNRGRIVLPRKSGKLEYIPIEPDGSFLIDWRLPPNHPALAQLPAHQLLWQEKERLLGRTNELANPARGKVVLIGSSALANDLTDRGATPLRKDTLLVSKHWNIANSILASSYVRRLSPRTELWFIALLGFCAAAPTLRLRPAQAVPVVVLLAGAYVWGAVMVYSRTRVWLPLVLPVLAIVFVHLVVLAWRVVFEQAERRKVRALFSKMVSPKIVTEVLSAETLSLGGAKVEVSVFFADVRGFTELTVAAQQEAAEYVRSKGLTGAAAEAWFDAQARETLETVNLYLGVIANVVITNDGTLDKFIGDCVMAFWGAPAPTPRHACLCVRAAIEAQRAVSRLNDERAAENEKRKLGNAQRLDRGEAPLPMLPLLTLGTGINTGPVIAGLMGSAAAEAESLSYTVFGREVNLASRLEGASGRGRIFVSETTYQHLLRDEPALAARCAAQTPVQLKGFSTPVNVFELSWKDA